MLAIGSTVASSALLGGAAGWVAGTAAAPAPTASGSASVPLPTADLSTAPGVDPTGRTDSAPGLNAALAALAADAVWSQPSSGDPTKTVHVGRAASLPAGDFRIDAPLTLPLGVSLLLDPATRLRAGATMTAILVSGATRFLERVTISGGLLDCAGHAASGISIAYGSQIAIVGLRVASPTGDGIVLGDKAAPANTYEVTLRDLELYRDPEDATPPPGKAAIRFARCTDSVLTDIVAKGYDIGVALESTCNANTLTGVHCWNPPKVQGPSAAFSDAGLINTYVACYADSPSQTGWLLQGDLTTLQSCRAFNNHTVAQDAVTAVRVASGTTALVTGLTVSVEQPTNRFAADVAGGGTVRYRDPLIQQGAVRDAYTPA